MNDKRKGKERKLQVISLAYQILGIRTCHE